MPPPAPLPDGLLITWYGDDFTGSAAVMEAMAFSGLPAVLFLDIPTPAQMARFQGLRGLGIASTARAQSPDWMDRHMPAPLTWLAARDAAVLHWKVCSTLDSSPAVGSIGRGAELALAATGAQAASVVIAAPRMRRYQAFGHLFAGTPDGVFRLDRHPVMARHPVTPMDESDVARHLSRQTALPQGLLDLEALAGHDHGQARLSALLEQGCRLIHFDGMDGATDSAVGRLLWENRAAMPVAVGSQGVEYALIAHWQAAGLIPAPPPLPCAGAMDRIVAVSGSVSPVTARQIGWAAANGFSLLPFDACAACGDDRALAVETDRCVAAGLAALASGQSVMIHTAAGPDDPAVAALRAAQAVSGRSTSAVNDRIGAALGTVLDGILRASGIRRAVVSGGDTSGQATARLGLYALTALAPTIPGAALFRAHGNGAHDGLELALKGGQMGSDDYFGWIRSGGGPRA